MIIYIALQGGFPAAGVVAAAVAFLLIAAGVMAYIVRRKRIRNKEKVEAQRVRDTDENPIYGLYARNSEEELPTESTVTDENDYYGV